MSRLWAIKCAMPPHLTLCGGNCPHCPPGSTYAVVICHLNTYSGCHLIGPLRFLDILAQKIDWIKWVNFQCNITKLISPQMMKIMLGLGRKKVVNLESYHGCCCRWGRHRHQRKHECCDWSPAQQTSTWKATVSTWLQHEPSSSLSSVAGLSSTRVLLLTISSTLLSLS